MWESNHGEGHKNMNIIKWVIVWFLASAVPPTFNGHHKVGYIFLYILFCWCSIFFF